MIYPGSEIQHRDNEHPFLKKENKELRAEIEQLREALHTIVCNTEPDAIKHRDYAHLAKDIYDCARAALGEGKE